MRVVFRVDASVQIGTGHLMRCLTLADELTRQGHDCRFICREHEGHLGGLISNKNYKFTMLPEADGTELESTANEKIAHANWLGVPWQQDAEQTLAVLTTLNADWLVVDHYALDARWEQQMASSVGRIMAIDDLADRDHACALLVDQNLGRAESDYEGLVRNDCIRLIGPEYALLRPEFAQFRQRSLKRRRNPELKRILISLGGVDRTNVTGQVLSALMKTALPEETQLDIIMGAAAPYLNEVRQQAAQLPFRATVSVNVNDMAERMCLADLSIGAAGGTSWERCCLGLPAVLVILADNQVSGARAMEVAGAVLTITDPQAVQADLPPELAKVAESECLESMSRAAAAKTDGKGTSRVVESMIAIAGRLQ